MGRHKKKRPGHKQHLFESGVACDPEFLVHHRELELLRSAARMNRSSRAHSRHVHERAIKLAEAQKMVKEGV